MSGDIVEVDYAGVPQIRGEPVMRFVVSWVAHSVSDRRREFYAYRDAIAFARIKAAGGGAISDNVPAVQAKHGRAEPDLREKIVRAEPWR